MSDVTAEDNLLSLSEYSNEYGVSVSTLRRRIKGKKIRYKLCLLYTSDAADDSLRVDLGGRRIIKKSA